jgi:hypothetical protein
MFTRNELAQLLNVDLKNIPYLLSSLGLEPIRLGKKYSNTLYDGEHLLIMKLALYFKELGLSYEFTKGYVKAVEKEYGKFILRDDIWVNFRDVEKYIEDIKKLKIFADANQNRKRIDWQAIEKGDYGGDIELKGKCYYLVLSAPDVKLLLSQLVDSSLRMDVETIRVPDEKYFKSELLESAKRNGIDIRGVEDCFNEVA